MSAWEWRRDGHPRCFRVTSSERTQDAWLRGVQNGLRIGKRSVETHAFLHEYPTMRPGSHDNGVLRCNNKKFSSRSSQATIHQHLSGAERLTFAKKTLEIECDMCKEKRESKQLVATQGNGERFLSDRFVGAPAGFANKAITYDVNRLRAKAFASKPKTSTMYCPAKDYPAREALRERSDLSPQKLHWLKRHDRENSDLH